MWTCAPDRFLHRATVTNQPAILLTNRIRNLARVRSLVPPADVLSTLFSRSSAEKVYNTRHLEYGGYDSHFPVIQCVLLEREKNCELLCACVRMCGFFKRVPMYARHICKRVQLCWGQGG